MSRIYNLLQQILSAVYGKDVRQSIHDAIEQCYLDVTKAKTLADESISTSQSTAKDAETRVNSALSGLDSRVNTAISNCNSATTAATTAASNASSKATAANNAAQEATKAKEACDQALAELPDQVAGIFADLGLIVVDGKLCVKVERSES